MTIARITIIVSMFLVAVLQTSFLPSLFQTDYLLELALAVVVACTILFSFSRTWIWTIFFGVIMDIFLHIGVGMNVLAFSVIAYLVSLFSRRFLIESRGLGVVTMILLISAAVVIYRGIILFLTAKITLLSGHFFSGISRTLPSNWIMLMIFNAGLFLVVFYLLKKIQKRINLPGYRVNII